MNILHMTDLHFAKDDSENEVREKWDYIKEMIQNKLSDKKVDAIAVTGDITSHGNPREFCMAKKYLLETAGLLEIKRKKVFFCPGNHDADTEVKGSSFFHYQSFLNEFYGKSSSEYLVEKKDRKTGKKKKYQFVSINTCTQTSLQFFDEAVIPKEALMEQSSLSDENYVILLMHHQPEVIKNQECFMQIADSGKVQLILCGHLHPTMTREYRAGKTAIINGMAVTPHLSWIHAGIQLIHIKQNGKIKIKNVTM